MTVEQQLETIIEAKDDLDLDLLESVRLKIAQKTGLSEDKKEDEKESADEQDQTPAVSIENPINPDLVASDTDGDGIDDSQETGEEDNEKKQPEKTVTDDKKTVRESVEELLGDEFSEDFKLKAVVIFEAAVKEQVNKIHEELKQEYATKAATLKESFDVKLVEETAKIEESLGEEINGYLTLMSEEWMQKNELAVQAGIKAELVESFIDGMKTLFEEHYVDLPEEKLDIVGNLEAEKKTLEESLEEANQRFATLTEEHNSVLREQIITESAKDFTGLDFQRFKTLTEDFAFESEEMFRKKVSIIKTAFFEAKAEKSSGQKETSLMESFVPTAPIIEETKIDAEASVTSSMDAYVKFLGKKK